MIANQVQEIIDLFIKNASTLANLSASSLLSLFCLVLLAVLAYDKKEARRKDDADREARGLKMLAETKTSEALSKLADSYERLADTSKAQIDIILRRP